MSLKESLARLSAVGNQARALFLVGFHKGELIAYAKSHPRNWPERLFWLKDGNVGFRGLKYYREDCLKLVATTKLDSPERQQVSEWLEAIEKPLPSGHIRVMVSVPSGVVFLDLKVDP